jgi:hypothetical protein
MHYIYDRQFMRKPPRTLNPYVSANEAAHDEEHADEEHADEEHADEEHADEEHADEEHADEVRELRARLEAAQRVLGRYKTTAQHRTAELQEVRAQYKQLSDWYTAQEQTLEKRSSKITTPCATTGCCEMSSST